ncbi:hypothetical protein CRUP_011443, partial [Coryphaenoides rupestris]
YALHFLVQSGLTYGIMILTGVEHMHKGSYHYTPFYAQVVYLYLSMLTTRPKYYFVWTLADAINNAAGFGFNGYDLDGSPRWDLISNLRIQNIELATSFKVFLDNWNIQTAHWLKR